MVHTSHGIRLVPELYAVPLEDVEAELASPGSQEFVATGRIPFMWAQSLYVISQLLKAGIIKTWLCNIDTAWSSDIRAFSTRSSSDSRKATENKFQKIFSIVFYPKTKTLNFSKTPLKGP